MAVPQAMRAERYKKLQAHYDILSSKASAGDSLLPDTAYADFLKEHDGRILPNVQQETRGSGPITSKTRPLSANSIRKHAQRSLDDSAKRLQAIEDHMWQHRQEERDLKRAEMDLIKQKKQVQRSMKEYESKLSKKQSEEASILQGREMATEQYRQKDLHQKKDGVKTRTHVALAGRQKLNEMTKKFIKTENEMSWRYRSLMESLELNRGEMETLSSEFQSKLRAKEEEQFQLKKELADVAISLNMEAHKIKQTEAESEKKQTQANKKDIQESLAQEQSLKAEEKSKTLAGHKFENTRRNLQHSVRGRKGAAEAKLRQGGRSLLDVRSRMQQNADTQQLIMREAEEMELDMMKQEMANKGRMVESKKRSLEEAAQRRREERNLKELKEWEGRYSYRETEARKREDEDRLKDIMHAVTSYDHLEQDMYNKAKGAETDRKKHDQILGKMHDDLTYLKRENARRLKEVSLQAEKAEEELQQKIQRENAEMVKAANLREETMRSLTAHRARTQEERKMLFTMKRECQRKARIQNRTTFLTQS